MNHRQKEIDALRAQIAKLEEQQAKEENEKKALESANQSIFDQLDSTGVSLEAFLRYNLKVVKRVMVKIEKKKKTKETPTTKKAPTKRRAVKKTRGRGAKRKAKTTVKIPAGKYSNIPSVPDMVFEIKQQGPRPTVLKSYAEEIGLEKFMEQCLVS